MTRFLPLLLVLVLAGRAQTAPDADSLFQKMEEQVQQRMPEGTPPERRHAWFDASNDRASRLAGEFADKYPSDPRAWEALGYVATLNRQSANPDEAAAFARHQQEVRTRIFTSPDVPESVLARVYPAALRPLLESEPAASTNRPRIEELLAQFRRRAPQAGSRAYVETSYLRALEGVDPTAAEAYARTLASDPNPRVVGAVRQAAAASALKREPISLKRTAFDGREVDFTQLRGKVVLIDFWATWCVPCMEQMPEIKRVYREYHDRGFEIVGVADEIVPKDPAKPRGAEKTPALLQAFLDKHEMTWPQLWDQRSVSERHGVNEMAALFGVESLPTTFLLDRDGRIYSTNSHGTELEQNVRKLLGLPATGRPPPPVGELDHFPPLIPAGRHRDPADQTAAKCEKAKQILTDFTTKTEMPRPQYYDGKFWKNKYAVEYTITSIPAMLLLDQDGKIVSTDARGEKLEQEVKRLLKL